MATTDERAMKARLAAVRLGLLELHKALLDAERAKYEQIHGLLETENATDSDRETLLATARTLLTTSGQSTTFAREYDAALQRDPHIVVLHGRVAQALRD